MNKGDFHGAYFHCKFQKDRLDLLTQVRRVSAKHPNNNHSPSEADGINSLTKLLNSAEQQLDNSDDEVLDDELEKALLASPIQSFDPTAAKRAKLNNGESININSTTSSASTTTNAQQGRHSPPLPNRSTHQSGRGAADNSSCAASSGNGNADGMTPQKPGTSAIQSAQNHGHKRVVIPGNTGTVPLPPHPFLLQGGAGNGGGKTVMRPRIPNNLPGILPDEPPSSSTGNGNGAPTGMPTISIPQLHRGISQNTELELQRMMAAGQGTVSAPNSYSSLGGMDSLGKPCLSRTGSDMWAQIDIEHANPVDSMIDDINFDEESKSDQSGLCSAGIASAPPSHSQSVISSPSIVPFSSGIGSPQRLPKRTSSSDHANLHLLSAVAFHRSSSQESEGGDNRLPVIEVKTLLSPGDEEYQP